MRILIADDHDLLRETLALLLEREPGFTVVHAATLDQALDRIGAEGPFDLVLLDYAMPGMNGLQGLQRALAAAAGRPVAMMSGMASRDVAEQALALGAAGFLPKTLPARSLLNALRLMAGGEQFAPVSFMTAPAPAAEEATLSPRESQVLKGLCDGLSNKEIARRLALQEPTIKLHVKTLCRKLGARNRTHAAMLGREKGL
jgi:two-component system nitrate/nitrite response regulator NarL